MTVDRVNVTIEKGMVEKVREWERAHPGLRVNLSAICTEAIRRFLEDHR